MHRLGRHAGDGEHRDVAVAEIGGQCVAVVLEVDGLRLHAEFGEDVEDSRGWRMPEIGPAPGTILS